GQGAMRFRQAMCLASCVILDGYRLTGWSGQGYTLGKEASLGTQLNHHVQNKWHEMCLIASPCCVLLNSKPE
ncbi:MAG: hypothetical protein JZU65_14750, partial [Chlorobium sp.]|nr:hypothetical protein [Chlorobium sp.]